jgi:hypothetical protein
MVVVAAAGGIIHKMLGYRPQALFMKLMTHGQPVRAMELPERAGHHTPITKQLRVMQMFQVVMILHWYVHLILILKNTCIIMAQFLLMLMQVTGAVVIPFQYGLKLVHLVRIIVL